MKVRTAIATPGRGRGRHVPRPRTECIQVFVSPEELDAIDDCRGDIPRSAWCRVELLDAVDSWNESEPNDAPAVAARLERLAERLHRLAGATNRL